MFVVVIKPNIWVAVFFFFFFLGGYFLCVLGWFRKTTFWITMLMQLVLPLSTIPVWLSLVLGIMGTSSPSEYHSCVTVPGTGYNGTSSPSEYYSCVTVPGTG